MNYKSRELKSLLAEANVDEVHLVLNMTASLKTLLATVEKFSAVNTTSLIMTKLDEAVGMGTLLSVSQKISLPITYLTTGQDVPDDIEKRYAGTNRSISSRTRHYRILISVNISLFHRRTKW